MTDVSILNVLHIAPSPISTAPDIENVKLSFFDTPWVVLPPVQRLFLYENTSSLPSFPSVLQSLKSSLAATLAVYSPLAGKLTYDPNSGDVSIDSSPSAIGEGVAFYEAKSDGDICRLASDEEHDILKFMHLVPELDARVFPAPLLSVQVTGFPDGGVAVGVSVHHAVADGHSLWRFMEAWAAASRVGSPVTEKVPAPMFGREVIQHPRGEEIAREILKKVAPRMPVAISFDVESRLGLSRRTFILTADLIQSLKQRIHNLATKLNGVQEPKPVSTFVALAALVWTAFVRAKSLNPDEDTHLIFIADLRSRLDPPVSDGYFGNCIKGCDVMVANASDLLCDAGLLHASLAIQKAVRAMSEDPLAGIDNWIEEMMKLPFSRLTNVAASPRFKPYETDFGFGKPSRVELVSMNHDGEVALVGGKEDGDVQVSVSLNPDHIVTFKSFFLNF